MDFKSYYINQIGGNYAIYRGAARQRGHGLGGIFKSMFKYLVPMFKTHALPVIKKGAVIVGNEAVKAASNIATDAIKGQNLKESFQNHTSSAVENLTNKAQARLQTGSGKKRKALNQKGKGSIKVKKYKKAGKKVKNSYKQKIRKIEDIFT